MTERKNIVILDTNTLISAFIFKSTNPKKALEKSLKKFTIVVSEETEKELLNVIVRQKFDRYLTLDERIEAVTDFLLKTITIEDIEPVEHNCRDPKDVPFLELAEATKTKFIISGDSDLLDLNPFNDTQIISPAEFIKL